jgi:hypothetical protein
MQVGMMHDIVETGNLIWALKVVASRAVVNRCQLQQTKEDFDLLPNMWEASKCKGVQQMNEAITRYLEL